MTNPELKITNSRRPSRLRRAAMIFGLTATSGAIGGGIAFAVQFSHDQTLMLDGMVEQACGNAILDNDMPTVKSQKCINQIMEATDTDDFTQNRLPISQILIDQSKEKIENAQGFGNEITAAIGAGLVSSVIAASCGLVIDGRLYHQSETAVSSVSSAAA